MNPTQTSGINETSVTNTVQKIQDLVDKLKQRFEQLNDTFDLVAPYMESNSGDEVKRKYTLIKSNYDVATRNLLSYAEDLERVKSNYRNFDNNASGVVGSYKPLGTTNYEGSEN